MNNSTHKITYIMPDSPASKVDLKINDILVSINDNELTDIFDYYYLSDDDKLKLTVLRNDEQFNIFVDKEIGEDLGITFENGLLDDYHSCSNKCIFCFIDQMPKGMRDTLYFKDDDTRLSFLQGNYVTLTNIKDKDLDRIIEYHLAPINVSVHTTNPELRKEMLNNRFAGDILDKIKKLDDAGLEMNSQIVLCKGINDGAELERTISDLLQFENMLSLSVVPVGLTKFREGLYPLESFDKESAKETLRIIHKWQDIAFEKRGSHFVQAGDEWYLLAEEPLPPEERYDGFIQLENGVGMLRLFINEFDKALAEEGRHLFLKKRTISFASGVLAAPFMKDAAEKFMAKFPKIRINVYTIYNDFFGEKITVSGLITGHDLIKQLKDKELGDKLIIPSNMLRSGEEVFLDDVSLSEASDSLQVPIDIVKSSGQSLIECLLN